MSKYLKIRIDWMALAKAISKKHNRTFSPSYVRDVGTGIHQSKIVKDTIKELIEQELSKPITINPKTLIKEM